MVKIAVAQSSSVWNSLAKSIEVFSNSLKEAKKENVQMVVFGESWLCGYPAWIDVANGVALWDNEEVKTVWSTMYHNSLNLQSAEYQSILSIIAENGIPVILGCNEVVHSGKGNGTIYNSILTFDGGGNLVNHHRKLMPTFTEKLVHGLGDGRGLKSVHFDFGSVGSLICWEHWMPLARQAMHIAGEDIHFALWPSIKERHLLASRHYAFEGRCFVVAVGQMQKWEDVPLPIHNSVKKQGKWLLNGGSCLISPKGELLSQPAFEKEGNLYFELDLNQVVRERMALSVAGHYDRPDVFRFEVKS